jgi:hypothetical protein
VSAAVGIGEPVTGGALRATHFFNGRLLTGEDLGREQDVQAARLARLAQALGEGVVDGLTVSVAAGSTAARPMVSVAPGLAVSRSGDALELAVVTDVSLAGSGPAPGTEPGALFAECQPYQPSEYSTGSGVYLLSIGPKTTKEGLAPVSGLHNGDAPCNTAYAVEGVSFRRLRLALPLSELNDREHLRNRVAYRIYAPDEIAALWTDPFGTALDGYGLLDELRPAYLRDDEVPLALLGWEAGKGITFVDHWSVRRRLVRRAIDDRLVADGEARLLQFQEHADALRRGPATGLAATGTFEWLPPAGLLPLATSTNARAFDALTFFAGMAVGDTHFIEGAMVQPLLRESLAFPPIDVHADEAIQLYAVRENAGGERPYLIFASAHLTYRANARWNLARWNLANFAERH